MQETYGQDRSARNAFLCSRPILPRLFVKTWQLRHYQVRRGLIPGRDLELFFRNGHLEELQANRKQATKLLSSHLASHNPLFVCSEEVWVTILEPGAWEFLVHHEFKAKGGEDFTIMLVY